MTRFLKFPNKFKISPKFCKKIKQIPRKFLNTFQTKPKNSTNPKKILQPQTKPQKISQKDKSPPPSPYFQPLKPFFVIFCNTFLKKFANFCHKSEKLYYNFIVLKICLQSRVRLNALQQGTRTLRQAKTAVLRRFRSGKSKRKPKRRATKARFALSFGLVIPRNDKVACHTER